MELVKLFAGDFGILRFLAGFVILPMIYLTHSAEVHKEFAASMKDLGARDRTSEEQMKKLKASLHFFELEWWFVAAVTIFLIGVFLLGNFASQSEMFEGLCQVEIVTETPSNQSLSEAASDPCTEAKGLLNAFGFVLASLAVFCVYWSKANAYRALQEHWFEAAGTQVAD